VKNKTIVLILLFIMSLGLGIYFFTVEPDLSHVSKATIIGLYCLILMLNVINRMAIEENIDRLAHQSFKNLLQTTNIEKRIKELEKDE
jgi:diacylglycerol kinase